jgi:hypothetical protein
VPNDYRSGYEDKYIACGGRVEEVEKASGLRGRSIIEAFFKIALRSPERGVQLVCWILGQSPAIKIENID